MRKHRKAIFSLVLVILAAIGIIGGYCWISVALKPSLPLRIAISSYSGHEYLVMAKEKGIFEEANIDVELVEYGSLSDVQRAFEWGQAHGMICKIIDVILTKHKSADLNPKIILIPSYPIEDGATVILAPSHYKSAADLKGKKIGVEIYSWGNFLLLKALRTVGLTLDDVVLVPADPTAMESLMRKGHIDVAVTYPPYASLLLQNKKLSLKQVFSSNELPKETTLYVLAVSNRVLQRRAKEWQKFVLLWDKLLEFKNQQASLVASSTAHHEKISPQLGQKIFDSSGVLTLEEQMSLFRSNKYVTQILGEMNNLLKTMGLINAPVNFETIFDGRFVRKAVLGNQN